MNKDGFDSLPPLLGSIYGMLFLISALKLLSLTLGTPEETTALTLLYIGGASTFIHIVVILYRKYRKK